MKKTLRALSIIAGSLLLVIMFTAFASATATDTFRVDGGATKDAADNIKLWTNGSEYYLFLPSSADANALAVTFEGAVSVNSVALVSGENTDVFAEVGKYKAIFDGEEITVNVLQSSLPAIFITTQSGSFDAINADKEYYEDGYITVTDGQNIQYDGKLDKIKGRGNSTWAYAKRPYNIKLNKKTDLFGMGKAKKWCLLANYFDKSLIRNQTAFYLTEMLSLEYSVEGTQCAVYLNGEYNGVYLITEKVEIGSNRVDITDLEAITEELNGADLDTFTRMGDILLETRNTYKWFDIPEDPEDITGGYLLEIDMQSRYLNEASGFVTSRGVSVVIKSPEYASKAQVEYIKDYYQDFEDALFAEDGYNSLGKHYTDYIDVVSFAKMYIVQDLTAGVDAGASSFFMYKEAGDVLKAGPAWDFDMALGNDFEGVDMIRDGYDVSKPDTEFIRESMYWPFCDRIVNALYDHADFETLVNNIWNVLILPHKQELITYMRGAAENVAGDAILNSIRWSAYVPGNSTAWAYKTESAKVLTFVSGRTEFLTEYYSFLHTDTPYFSLTAQTEDRPASSEPVPNRNNENIVEKLIAFINTIIKLIRSVLMTGIE